MFRAPGAPAAPTHSPATPTPSQLTLTDVTKRYADHTVLEGVRLTVRPGEKAGVIGDNGSGKSTLLRLMAGQERPDSGTVTVFAPGGTGHLAQTLDLPDSARVGDAVDLALAELRALERRIHAAGAALDGADPDAYDAYAALVSRFEARGGYGADRRVDVALRHLGERTGLDRARRLGTLSGGQRSRLALAATLASAPELLLLDEPTNDLDDEAAGPPRPPAPANAPREKGEKGGGGAGAPRQSRLAESHIGRLGAIPRKLPRGFSGAGAFRARSRAHGAQSRIRGARERLLRLTENPAPAPPEPLRFTASIRGTEGAAPAGVGRAAGVVDRAVEVVGLRVPGRVVLDSLYVPAGGRLLVTGPNGAGKSTLLRVLAGELAAVEGLVRRPERVGVLRQTVATPSGADASRSLLAAFGEQRADELLALGLFRAEDLRRPVGALSAGQRRRLELARLVTRPYDLLLLDEPTNHLSPGLVEDLEAALAGYTGTLIVVSHDRRLRAGFRGPVLELVPQPRPGS
ncbi:ATP-binding cassette domain-containing protein [Streptomyces aureocirculatus]|uniref:ATP-binding cassette domain-containing protein n=1 Tax=Streptomyces aureocirculatus TaxID=67275 RepID=UPI000568090D|nr:ATP-binding cassette domain-containing protein [Streptomyces aureocirculatus]